MCGQMGGSNLLKVKLFSNYQSVDYTEDKEDYGLGPLAEVLQTKADAWH